MSYDRVESPQPIGDRLGRIEARTESMARDITEIKAEVHNVTEMAFPRTEADSRSRDYDRRMLELTQAVGSRMETATYQVAHDALIQRVATLESSPQRAVAWYAVIISAGVGCLTVLIMLIGALISIAALIISLVR